MLRTLLTRFIPILRHGLLGGVLLMLAASALAAQARPTAPLRVDSTYDAGTDEHMILVLGRRLQVSSNSHIFPVWRCAPNGPCHLEAIRFTVVLTKVSATSTRSDSDAILAYNIVMMATSPLTLITLDTPSGVEMMRLRAKNLPVTSRSPRDGTIIAAADFGTPEKLEAFLTAQSITVDYSVTPLGGKPYPATRVAGADAWLRQLQATRQRLAAERPAAP